MVFEHKLNLERHPWSHHVEFIYAERRDGRLWVARPIELLERGPEYDGVTPEITFSLPMGECQALMDRLWQIGLRPSEGTSSAGALAATQKHLEDMRKLVFKE